MKIATVIAFITAVIHSRPPAGTVIPGAEIELWNTDNYMQTLKYYDEG